MHFVEKKETKDQRGPVAGRLIWVGMMFFFSMFWLKILIWVVIAFSEAYFKETQSCKAWSDFLFIPNSIIKNQTCDTLLFKRFLDN